ncbi:MAG: hypothetical protein U5N56_03625 [Candidatus Marinimicrobia bacterium]|nr:hypothetical protein [Candidatus Neomarinimicrobiota bacterium]
MIDYYIGGDWGKDLTDEENNSKYFCIRGADFPNVFDRNLSNIPARYTKERNLDKRKLRDGDIVLEISGGTKGRPVGRTIYMSKYLMKSSSLPFSYSNFCRLIRTSRIYNKYLFGYLTHIYSTGQIEQYQVQSTGIANFQFNDFLEKEILVIPNNSVLAKFNEIISAIYDKKYNNENAVLQTNPRHPAPQIDEWGGGGVGCGNSFARIYFGLFLHCFH